MLFPILASQSMASINFNVVPGRGLFAASHRVPILNGSSIQFYKPGWTKTIFSTADGSEKILKVDSSTLASTFTSPDGLARGTVVYTGIADHLKVHYDLLWVGDEPANVEIAAGYLWAPAFEHGTLTVDGKSTRPLNVTDYKTGEVGERRFSPDSTTYSFATPIGAVTETSSLPLTLFDGRGLKQDWATHHEYLWLGNTDAPMQKGKHLILDVDYQVDFSLEGRSRGTTGVLQFHRSPNAQLPDNDRPPLIPKPMDNRLSWAHPLVYEGAFKFPIGQFDHLDTFKAALARRFEVPVAKPTSRAVSFDGGVSKLGLVPGGYKITIENDSISVLGEEDEGLANGLERLAALAYVSNGKICFPTGFLRDQPHTAFRGVHLFVGKQALPFQEKLWNRVLRPLGFNKVVLQCERTHWNSQPNLDTALTMSKNDLIRLFGMYRGIGVEPIPLIESFGHMDWFFANGSNLDLALDSSHPFAVDPSKPNTRVALTNLWDEVISALHPNIVHFGMDEVDLEGKPLTAGVKTRLWATQLGVLEKIAKSHGVEMMLWGDQALSSEEAPDAALAETEKDASERRSAIPRGSLIGDWHYLANPAPSTYVKNLQVWKDAGLQPIATTWYRPDNIAGFDVEAGRMNCGTLQTTWCGYDSSEANVKDAYEQFTAMILAADYSWSARPDRPDQLGYDPAEVFRKMYFGQPSALLPLPGFDLDLPNPSSIPLQIGNIRYGTPGKVILESDLAPSGHGLDGAIFTTNVQARKLAFAVNSLVQAPDDGLVVADILIAFTDGKKLEQRLTYGMNIRSLSDLRPIPLADRNRQGICSVVVDLGGEKSAIRAISIKPFNAVTGLSLQGIEAIE